MGDGRTTAADKKALRLIATVAAEMARLGAVEQPTFRELADDYARDARRHSRTMTALYTVTLLAVALGAAGAIWAAAAAVHGSDFAWREFLGRGSVVIVMLFAASVATWQADRHRRLSSEWLRLARQLRTYPTFINSMDSGPLQDLIRGALTPRFFPRALDDDDVLREPNWPSPDQLSLLLRFDSSEADEERNSSSELQSSDVPAST
jgi:ABC-type multidrug transport system fused ATPase/permease subunit